MVIKMGRYGKFLACPGFPECRNTKPLLEPIGVPCPRCEGEIVIRRSKKGRKFYGCSRYPQCEFVTWDPPSKTRCPKCGDLMVEKKERAMLLSLSASMTSATTNFVQMKKNRAGLAVHPEKPDQREYLYNSLEIFPYRCR